MCSGGEGRARVLPLGQRRKQSVAVLNPRRELYALTGQGGKVGGADRLHSGSEAIRALPATVPAVIETERDPKRFCSFFNARRTIRVV